MGNLVARLRNPIYKYCGTDKPRLDVEAMQAERVEAAAEIERLRAIEVRARLVIKEWHAYGDVKPPIVDQLVALEELLDEQKAP